MVISGSSLNEIITFDELTDSITVTITLVDDAVALETVEQYDISLVLVMNDSRVVLGTPNVATINILDDDCEKYCLLNYCVHVPYSAPGGDLLELLSYIANFKSHTYHASYATYTYTCALLYISHLLVVGIGFNSSDLTVLESDQDVRVCVDKFDRTAQEFTADLDHTPGTAVPPVGEKVMLCPVFQCASKYLNWSDSVVRCTLYYMQIAIAPQNISFSNNADYNGTSVPTTLTFAGNDISVCFRVSVEEDGIALEPPETFTLAITGTSHSDVEITLDTSVITILDSDGQYPHNSIEKPG